MSPCYRLQSLYFKGFFSLLVAAALLLSGGCDKAREQIAAAVKPKTAADVTILVNEQIGKLDFAQAKAEGESFLAANDDASGQLPFAVAKACSQLHDIDCALARMGQALKAGALSAEQVISEPLLEPVLADVRFLALLSANGDLPKAAPGATAPRKQASDTSIKMDGQGTEVRAGDIVIKLPN